MKEKIKKLGANLIWAIVCIILVLILMQKCSDADSAKKEALREHNNYLASQDSVRFISKKLGVATYEKSAMELKMSDLSDENKSLINKLDLSGKKTPGVVIDVQTQYVDKFVNVPTKVEKDSSGQNMVTFLHNPSLPGKNYLMIKGKVPYDLNLVRNPNDSSLVSAILKTGSATIDMEQRINITTGIYRDPKSKRLMTRVSTDYPGISFSDINSFEIIDNPETRQALKAERRRIGFGINAGYGVVFANAKVTPGFVVGVGLNFTPRPLQIFK